MCDKMKPFFCKMADLPVLFSIKFFTTIVTVLARKMFAAIFTLMLFLHCSNLMR